MAGSYHRFIWMVSEGGHKKCATRQLARGYRGWKRTSLESLPRAAKAPGLVSAPSGQMPGWDRGVIHALLALDEFISRHCQLCRDLHIVDVARHLDQRIPQGHAQAKHKDAED